MRQIINPLLKLAGAAKRIAANDMYVPDLRVQNRDEIGELVQTFNVMKHSMYQSITTLREKNEIELSLIHIYLQLAVQRNAGGVYAHELYFDGMTPSPGRR